MKLRNLAAILIIVTACAAPAPTPVPTPATAKPSNRLTPTATSPRAIAEPIIRVGLVTDASEVKFPRIDDGYVVITDSGPSIIRRGFRVDAPLAGAAVKHAIQVAAISDKTSAETLAKKLRDETGQRVDPIFDAASGTYKVLLGLFDDAASAEPVRGQLTQQGYAKDMLIVRRPSEQPFERVHKLTDDEGDQYTISSPSLLVLPVSAEAIEIAKQPYRGGARVFINSRGLINVINELNLEEYLRGVVPNELGPRTYDELEALKAQTLAARTYAVGRLGEYAPEGYDICPTPACQVYRGYATEEKLSDQAIAETTGLIITHGGKPIDALYTSTCGGETSDVGVMFPGRTDPYLRRARCVEMEMVSLAGRADSGMLSEMQGDARLFAALANVPEKMENWSANVLVNLVSKATSLAGMTLDPALAPKSIRRGDALAYIGSALKLQEGAKIVLLPEDRQYFFPQSEKESPHALAASFLIKYKIAPTQHIDRVDLSAPMPRDEVMALLYSWLRRSESIREASGKIAAVSGREVVLKAEGKRTTYSLPAGAPLLRRFGERLQEYASVPIMIGDRASILLRRNGSPAAMVVQGNYDGASFDRTSSYASWVRSYRADELVNSIGRRNPIQKLLGIRPLVVDPSNRIAEMEITAEGGRTFILRGLPIRWSLNVPDNLFVYHKTSDPDGVDRYTFYGKGWGHGVGLCQVGAYGMAFRGWTAEQIIKRFYTGVEIVKWEGRGKQDGDR